VIVYRISSAKYPNNDGEGASINGGRWNRKGTPLLYCAATVSLCALEVLANNAALPQNMVSIAAEIPVDLLLMAVLPDKLPPDWNSAVHSSSTQDIGTKWARAKGSVAIMVPSVIVPEERNYLINPLHPDFARINFSAPKPFVFDPRLK
jgi:RES domain-containing protein